LSENLKNLPYFALLNPLRLFSTTHLYARKSRKLGKSRKIFGTPFFGVLTRFSSHFAILAASQPPSAVLASGAREPGAGAQLRNSLFRLSLRRGQADESMAHSLLLRPPTPPCAGSGVLL
jgi:hypothetical protein